MKKLEFSHIIIIESLRPDDELTGTRLFNRAIYPGMKDKGLGNNCELITVTTKNDFFEILSKIKNEIIALGAFPIIHLEMHGSETGLQVTNYDTITWEELQPKLIELNVLCKNNLFLIMATCSGGYIYNAISPRYPSPFWGFVGPFEKVNEDEVLADFTNFYFEFLDSLNLNKAVAALQKQNTPNASKFKFQNVEFSFQLVYKNYEKKHLTPERIEERLGEIERECKKSPDFEGWSSRRIREFAKNIILDENLKEKIMSRFFMWDIYPELKDS